MAAEVKPVWRSNFRAAMTDAAQTCSSDKMEMARAVEAATKVSYHGFLTNFSFYLHQHVSRLAASPFIICFSSFMFLFFPLTGFMIPPTSSDSAGGEQITLLAVMHRASGLTK